MDKWDELKEYLQQRKEKIYDNPSDCYISQLDLMDDIETKISEIERRECLNNNICPVCGGELEDNFCKNCLEFLE